MYRKQHEINDKLLEENLNNILNIRIRIENIYKSDNIFHHLEILIDINDLVKYEYTIEDKVFQKNTKLKYISTVRRSAARVEEFFILILYHT